MSLLAAIQGGANLKKVERDDDDGFDAAPPSPAAGGLMGAIAGGAKALKSPTARAPAPPPAPKSPGGGFNTGMLERATQVRIVTLCVFALWFFLNSRN
jgi:hypothetical protein